MADAVDGAVVDVVELAALVGADVGEALELPGCRLSDDDAGLGEDDAATLGDVTGRRDGIGATASTTGR